MLKKLSAFIVLLSFAAQSLGSQFMALDYYLNTAAYAKNCINKARPALHCNGKCQFMKKLAQQEKKEQQNAEGKSAGKNELLFSSRSFFTAAPLVFISKAIVEFPLYQENGTVDFANNIFHPPGA